MHRGVPCHGARGSDGLQRSCGALARPGNIVCGGRSGWPGVAWWAEIVIPPGALDHDTAVSIMRKGTPSDLAHGGPQDVYEFDVGRADLRNDVRLYLPAPASTTADSINVLAYLDDNGTWAAVPAELENGRLTAQVGHLSLWSSLDLAAWIGGNTDALTALARLGGLRAAPPRCPEGAGHGNLAYSAAERLVQPPVLACLAAAPDGSTHLKITNNRSYAMSVDSSNLDAQPIPALDSGALEHAVALIYSRDGTTVIPPGGAAEYVLPPAASSGWITYRPAPSATFAMVDLDILADLTDNKFATAKAVAIVDCARDIGNDLTAVKLALARCVVSLIQANIDLARLGIIRQLGSALIGPVVAYIVATLNLAPRVLDAWADLALFNAANDRLTVSHPLQTAAPPPAPTAPAPHAPAPVPTQPAPVPSPSRPTTQAPAPQPRPVVHYDCANDDSNIGKYISSGRYWQNTFQAVGTSITNGWVLIGANNDGHDHRAIVGIYGSVGLGSPLARVEVAVSGYDGENFTLPQPLQVTVGQQLYLTVVGVGDFTAYDSRADCFIGTVRGDS